MAERTSKILRVRDTTADRIADLAKREHRNQIQQLDLVIDAGLKAMGEPGLFEDAKA